MKSIELISKSLVAESSRRNFLQMGAQTATVFLGGSALAGCGGGGSSSGPTAGVGNLLPPATNPSGNDSSPPATGSSVENQPTSHGAATTAEDFSPTATSPIIRSFSPSAEVVGNVIVITGSRFDSTASVSFGAVSATQFRVDSATQISVTVPASATSGPVIVRTAGGAVRSSAHFSVLTAPTPATGYRLAWHDEFDGTSVDGQKWRMVNEKRDDAQQTPSAIDVADGIVTISTYTDAGTHYTGWLDTNKDPGCKFTFGYIEARVRFVNAPGQWSAFWLMSNSNRAYTPENPAAGVEIDIIEHRAVGANNVGDFSNRHSSAVHWNGYKEGEKKSAGSGVKPLPVGESFSEWHTAGVLWTPDKYQFFLDGKQFWETSEGISKSPEYILLTTEIKDQDWAGNIPPEGYGRRGASSNPVMQVDWVRLWQP